MSSSSKPNLLFVTPWTPRPTGSGPAMRAYYSLQALSRNYQPHVLIVGVYEGGSPAPPSGLPARWARANLSWRDPGLLRRFVLFRLLPKRYYSTYQVPSEWRFATDLRIKRAAQVFAGVDFDLIHVFRLYATPYARPYVDASPSAVTQLDLDEVESSTRERIAVLHETNGDHRAARRFRRDVEVYSHIEQSELPRWQRVLVASEIESKHLRSLVETVRVDVAPNVFPATPLPPSQYCQPFRFLFVGQLGYDPNADALLWFMRDVWPLLRKRENQEVELDVVGSGASRRLARELRSTPGVRYWGRVENLDRIYAEVGAVIVPLRAGGGTRIKVLEAFARGVPVVSTSIGVEGLNVVADRDLLVAHDEIDFAAACLKLAVEPDLRETLRENAHRLCLARYQPQAMAEVLAPSVEVAGVMADR